MACELVVAPSFTVKLGGTDIINDSLQRDIDSTFVLMLAITLSQLLICHVSFERNRLGRERIKGGLFVSLIDEEEDC